jgi:hypothetical protein
MAIVVTVLAGFALGIQWLSRAASAPHGTRDLTLEKPDLHAAQICIRENASITEGLPAGIIDGKYLVDETLAADDVHECEVREVNLTRFRRMKWKRIFKTT